MQLCCGTLQSALWRMASGQACNSWTGGGVLRLTPGSTSPWEAQQISQRHVLAHHISPFSHVEPSRQQKDGTEGILA